MTSEILPIQFLREAAPYIKMHQGKTFVIAFSGESIKSKGFTSLLHDIAILSSLGANIVLVHGARPQVDAKLSAKKIENKIVNGRRITGGASLAIIQNIIGGLRIHIENKLSYALNKPSISNSSIGVVSGNFITAKPIGVKDGVDFLHTGELRKIDDKQINHQLDHNNIVLLSPLGFSPTGEKFNLRYEEVASFTAQALNADKLIFIDEYEQDLETQLNQTQLKALIEEKKSNSRLLRHISNAMKEGVERVHLINQDVDGALLLELYTSNGSGTAFTKEYNQIRKATINDVCGIIELIKPLEEQGKLIKRSREQLELEIDNFCIVERDNNIIACSALYPTSDDKTVELACLAVNTNHAKQGLGDLLLTHLCKQAKSDNKEKLLALTTQSTDWFKERGFETKGVSNLPDSKKALYNFQRQSVVLVKAL